MPKDTFFNLPEGKRHNIEQIALAEFVQNGFDKASINRIIDKAGIAKGSFYQYFTNKQDVFIHLMSKASEEKLKYMSPLLGNPEEHDFFTLLREMYISGLRFAHANPDYVAIGNQVLKNKEHPIYKKVVGDGNAKAMDVFVGLIERAKEKGEIREDVDAPFVSYIISNMNVSTIEYYYEVVKGTTSDMLEWDDDIMDTVNLFIDLMKRGIQA